jgi:hypothetical protein
MGLIGFRISDSALRRAPSVRHRLEYKLHCAGQIAFHGGEHSHCGSRESQLRVGGGGWRGTGREQRGLVIAMTDDERAAIVAEARDVVQQANAALQGGRHDAMSDQPPHVLH